MDFVVPIQLIKTWLEFKLWFAKILTFFITSLKPNYETDDIDVSMICLPLSFYMCFYLEIANNPVCKTSGAFFFVQGQSILRNYESNNFDYEDGF